MPANTPASWLDSFHSPLLAGVMWRIHKSQAMPGDSSESMKALVLSLKIVASVFIFIALVAFGSDFLPVDGISFGGQGSEDGEYRFFKIVPTDGANPIFLGVIFLLVAFTLFIAASLLNKYLARSSST